MVSNLAATALSPQLTSRHDTAQLRRDALAHLVGPFTHLDNFKRDGSLLITAALAAYVFCVGNWGLARCFLGETL
jgi:hypothetical protein